MKYVFFSCFFLSSISFIYCQDQFSNIWLLGYPPNDSASGYGGSMINFNFSPPKLSYFPILVGANNSVQICNREGIFQFYSNGCKIVNYNQQLMSNGDQINPGVFHNEWCSTGLAYETRQGMIVLPWPDRDDEYAMFHLGWHRTAGSPPRNYLQDFYFTRINMALNDGLGEVSEKNTLLLKDTNLLDNLTAVRHGNGRDWWIVQPRGGSDTFYLFLLTPYEIKGPIIEESGLYCRVRGYIGGQVVFSPDGTKYVRVNILDGIDIFDFDRCRGKFVYSKRLPFPGILDDGIPMGASISPSSRYLYVSVSTKLFQYDLQAANIEASKILIDAYDGFRDTATGNFQTLFYQHMLGPDNKIYMSVPSTTHFFHVIHNPDAAGIACNFRQHDLRLPALHGFSVPNFPHFRLYDLPASPCDSLGIDAPEEYRVLWSPSDGIRLFPNPIGMGTVNVTIPPGDGGVLRVFNAAGQYLAEYKIDNERLFPLDSSAWPNGVYMVTFSTAQSKRPMAARLVVCK